MKVLVDATSMPGRRVGVARYVIELANASTPLCDLEVWARKSDSDAFVAKVRTKLALPRPARVLAGEFIDGLAVNRIGPDVFHGTHYTLPAGLRAPSVVTFHDPTMLTMPEVHEPAKVMWFRRAIPKGIRRATEVICVSEYARAGAIEFAGADPRHTHTVPLGVDHSRYRPGDFDRPLADAVVGGPFILWVGAVEPRKNVPGLVRAFTRIASQIPHKLVLAGPDAWGAAEVTRVIANSGFNDRIVRTGWVSEDTKAALYRAADAFVYPSRAEGFGLPALEALASGTPTVTTSGSAPEEVCGDAAIVVPPGDDQALADAVMAALTTEASRLRAAGPERAASFSWEATARLTVDVWSRACG